MGFSDGTVPLTGADESFTHQLVAPMIQPAYTSPAWGDRCYHLLHVDGLTINAGRQLYVNDRRRYAFLGVASQAAQVCIRANAPFAPGDDPDEPSVGPVSIEVLEPLKRIRITAAAQDVQVDLVYTARFPAAATDAHLIESDGVAVTDYMNFFQSGWYDGSIVLDGERHEVVHRAGFRDRGWGLRKHEGSPRRGFVAALFCELPDASLYLILYETASGRRVFTNGWWIDEAGVSDRVVAADHDLVLDGTLVTGAHYEIDFASGAHRSVDVDVITRNYLAGIGYSADPRFRTTAVERFDLTRPETVALLDGQNDNGSIFSVDGVAGHGYLETGIGAHARYRPD
jgi:hypothetical protein